MKIRSNLNIKIGIELAAMVDIVFLLVIYFLLNTTLVKQTSINIQLPKSTEAKTLQQKEVVIYITEKSEIYINKTLSNLQTLQSDLKKHITNKKEDAIIIRGDKTTNYQVIIDVMDQIHQAGISKFHLATER